MEEALEFEGKRYISSKRAAQLVGYTKDYVGQLARAGKVDARLVGRSWYVAEDSIRSHKLNAHYTLTQPTKPRRSDPQTEEVVTAETPSERPSGFVRVRVTDQPAVEQGPTEVRLPVREQLLPQTSAEPVAPAAEQPVRPTYTARTTRIGRDPLVQTDIRYEPGPHFYEDDGPILPTLNKETRFKGEPLPRPQTPVTQPRPVQQFHSSAKAPRGGVSRVDGIQVERRERPRLPERGRAERPQPRPKPGPGALPRPVHSADGSFVDVAVWVAVFALVALGSVYVFRTYVDTAQLFSLIGL